MPLPTSSLIRVTVSMSPGAAQAQSTNTMLILGSSSVIDVVSRRRTYSTLSQIATDFGTLAPEYLAAAVWFAQTPQPTQLFIGRWAQASTSGRLIGGVLSSTLAAWNAVVNGGFSISIDGGAAQNLAALNFAAAANLNGVASIINAVLVGAVVTYNSVYNRFEVRSNTTGAISTVSFVTPGAGVDISSMLGLTLATGAYQANGIVAETALAAVTLFDQKFGRQWYALAILGAANADHLAVASYIEASTTKHFYVATTQEAGSISPVSTIDLAYLMSQARYAKSAVQYSSTNAYAAISMMGKQLTVNYSGSNTAQTLMYKQEPGIVPENLDQTAENALAAKNCNAFVQIDNNTNIIMPGVCSSGDFIDSLIGADALALAVQTDIYNPLYTNPKVSQTDSGIHILTTIAEQTCLRFQNAAFLAPGIWTGPSFGSLQNGQLMEKGYYVYSPPIGQQSIASRAARLSSPIQIAAKLAGAVHTVDVSITVNP